MDSHLSATSTSAKGQTKSSTSHRRILILGGGFHNKGAEAMMLTVADHLRHRFPGCEVLHHAEIDAWTARLRSVDITPLPASEFPSHKRMLMELGLTSLPFRIPAPLLATAPEHEGICGAVDVSGFASGDSWGAGQAEERWWLVQRIKNRRVPVVFLPQAWGPFTDPVVRRYTRAMLRGCPMVYVRDRQSHSHIENLGVVPPGCLVRAADVAFQFAADPPDAGRELLKEHGADPDGRAIVGLAPNTHVYDRTPGEDDENDYVRFLGGICDWFAEHTRADLVIVPHEFRAGGKRDDRFVGDLVRKVTRHPERVHLVKGDSPAAQVKAAIGLMEFLVASRFHAIIAALSMRVPLAAIGWSHKYAELMCDARIGEYRIPRANMAEGVEIVRRAWQSRDELRERLSMSVPVLEASSASSLRAAADAVAASTDELRTTES